MKFFAILFAWLLSSFAAAVPQSCHLTASNGAQNQISPRAIVSDACVSYADLEGLNRKAKPALDDLTRNTDFFSHYRLNLFSKTCPFWNDENSMCGNRACAVTTIDNEDEIPLAWRASELSKLEGPKAEHPGRQLQKERPQRPLQGLLGEHVGESCVVEYDDECDERDYCVPEDESTSGKGDYVSLNQNPERFTGYGGESAKMVWDFIYGENCFPKSTFSHKAGLGMSPTSKGPAEQDFRAVLQDAGRQQVVEQLNNQGLDTPVAVTSRLDFEDECLEKRVFHRLISGMHASISAHVCWEYLDQKTGEWQPNASCYDQRLHSHPERVANIYFNYALLTRAIAKMGPHLKDYAFCMGDSDQDAATKALVQAVAQNAMSAPNVFNEKELFVNGEGPKLKAEVKYKFRNISRTMDCVVCDKCRLWGKIQTAGYGAALKILFEFANDEVPVLTRTELVALFNTYGRLSNSLETVVKFRAMLRNQDLAGEAKDEKAHSIQDRAKKPHAVGLAIDENKTAEVFEDWEDENPASVDRTVWDEVKSECGQVLLAFRIVIRTYVRMPKTVWYIFVTEMNRFWEWFIGLPITPRVWRFERPSLGDLQNERPEL
ncbi:endoplasmic oxidoreductin-1 [Xylariales sp. AK1849]|nr:endoplasmic oxidoreductin-1 [Xylariales sp. AK1849]